MMSPLAWMIAFSVMTNLLVLAVPLYLLQVYDRVLTGGSLETLAFLSYIAAGAIIALGALEASRSAIAQRCSSRLAAQRGSGLFRSVLLRTESGRAAQADTQPLRDLATVRSFISSRVAIGLLDLPFVPLFIAVVFLVHPALGWLTVAGAAVLIAIAAANGLATRTHEREAATVALKSAVAAQAQYEARDEIRAMGMQDRSLAAWGALEAQAVAKQDSVGLINAAFFGLSRTVRMGLQIAILGFGALLVLQQGLSAGIIFAVSIVSARALSPIDNAIGGWRSIGQAMIAWRRLRGELEMTEPQDAHIRLPEARGELTVENLTFVPQRGAEPLLKRLTFNVAPGECVALIGASGAGKTTLARVIAGAQLPTGGAARLDGVALHQWNHHDRAAAVGYLPQDLTLLSGTVAQNIARLDADPPDGAVVQASLFTGTHDLIGALPNGYATPVGGGGLPLSGGQRQLIGLARAFYGGPKLVVLDEPDAHLDEAGMRALEATISRARNAGITVVLATQRRGILSQVDRIMVLHQGQIKLFGPRDQVIAKLKNTKQSADSSRVAPMSNYRPSVRSVGGRSEP